MMNLNLQQTEQSNQGWKHFGPLTAAVVLLVAGGSLFAQQGATAKPAVQPAVARAEQEREAEPTGNQKGEGIRVHGHWVLQVKNADGTLGERKEFENSLVTTYTTSGGSPATTSGAAILVAILSGNLTVGQPAIGFVQTTQPPLTGDPSLFCSPQQRLTLVAGVTCHVFGTPTTYYNLAAPGPNPPYPSQIANDPVQSTLQVSASLTPTAGITMTGNYTVPASLTRVYAVESLVTGCISTASPLFSESLTSPVLSGSTSSFVTGDIATQVCQGSNAPGADYVVFAPLTETAVPGGPLAVTPGQAITVTFTLSFS